jgi:hypothetical protein
MYHIRRDTTHKWHTRLKAMDEDEALMVCIEGAPGLPNVAEMTDFTTAWLKSGAGIIPLRYESLLMNPAFELNRVFQSLEIQIQPQLLHAVTLRNRFERLSVGRKIWKLGRKPGEEDTQSHFRKGIAGDWRNHLNASHGETLVEWGYEKNTRW